MCLWCDCYMIITSCQRMIRSCHLQHSHIFYVMKWLKKIPWNIPLYFPSPSPFFSLLCGSMVELFSQKSQNDGWIWNFFTCRFIATCDMWYSWEWVLLFLKVVELDTIEISGVGVWQSSIQNIHLGPKVLLK